MGFRFRKSLKIAPGVKINFNKKSTGVTFGGKGFHYTVNSKGKKTTSVGIPGTGLSYSTSSGGSSQNKTKKTQGSANVMNTANTKKWYQKTGFIILLLIVFFPVGLFLMWKYTNWNKNVKIAVSAILALLVGIGIITSDADKDSTETDAPVNGIVENSTNEDEGVAVTEEFTTKTETTTEEKTTVEKTTVEKTTVAETTTEKQTTTEKETTTEKPAGRTVYITNTGKKYHYIYSCAGNGIAIDINDAKNQGYTPCKTCVE